MMVHATTPATRGAPVIGRSAAGRHRRLVSGALSYAALLAVGALLLVPLIWMLLSSVKAPDQVLSLSWLPTRVVFANYADIWQRGYVQYFLNSTIVSGLATAGSVANASLVAFGFARLRFWGRDALFGLVLATMMLPAAVTLVPTFILFKGIGWYDTFVPLILPAWLGAGAYGGGALYIFLVRQFYLTLPIEMDEAARLDGATSLQIYRHIMVPLSLPALSVVTVFAFASNWNDFLYPLVFIQAQARWTLALAVQNLVGELQHGTVWGSLMAGSVIMVLPVAAVVLASQRTFIRGVATSGLTGR